EGMLIGCVAAGAEFGFIYIRDEYPLAVARMRTAIAQARERGLLGRNVLGSGLDFDLEVVRGAGAYVCGEETGLIASIQDYRGMPRIKPPFPAQAGVFMKPTNVNNVESYASAPSIIVNGAEWYAARGTERAKGTKIFSLSGDVQRVCIVELPLGTPLRTLFEVAGGGLRDPSRTLKAVQPGGPLGGFITGEMIDIALEPAAFAAESVMMGSGGFVFMDDRSCVVDMAKRLVAFDRDESCGRCTTCRAGSMRLVDILERITSGRGVPTDIDLLRRYTSFMPNANCAHGQLTPSPINALLKFFMDDVLEHINERRCTGLACHTMVEYQIDPERSAPAAAAIPACPTGAIVQEGERVRIVPERCIRCGICAQVAPEAVRVGSPHVAWPAREPVGAR
ncbi:MAG: SLBB domain-containing protein, partial [Chloroflexi bacterium]|nr:SLBB domain-containing protein [Chloroflexota bacterium]